MQFFFDIRDVNPLVLCFISLAGLVVMAAIKRIRARARPSAHTNSLRSDLSAALTDTIAWIFVANALWMALTAAMG